MNESVALVHEWVEIQTEDNALDRGIDSAELTPERVMYPADRLALRDDRSGRHGQLSDTASPGSDPP